MEKVENFIFKMMRQNIDVNIILTPRQILNMMTGLRASTLFKQTGGLHNAAISDGEAFFEHRQVDIMP